jgi:hypothetical protein
MATYAELIDDFELEKRIRTIPEDMDLTEYIKQRGGVDYPEEEKADGGAIGIEVLFEKKKNGGRVGFNMGGAQFTSGGNISPGTDKRGNIRDDNPFTGGGDRDDKPSFKEKVKSVVTNPVVQLLGGAVLTGGTNLAFPGALEKLNKARMIKNAIDYARDVAPDEAIEGELENIQTEGGISPYANGGRVGLFMGGPALEGQALAIYNSMKAYGETDQAIADKLQSLGYYDPNASTTPPPATTQPVGYQGGNDKGIMELQKTFTRPPGSEPSMSEDALFGLGRFFQGKERGTLGNRLQKQFQTGQKLPSFFAAVAGMRSPFNPDSPTYNPDFADQLNFLELGDGLIGLSSTGYKYGPKSVLSGQNVISGFGSNDYLKQLNKFLAKTRSDKRRQQGIEEKAKFIMAEEKRKEEEARKKQLEDAAEVERLNKLGRDVSRGGFDPTGPTQASIRASRPDRSGATGQNKGGFTNPGKGSYGPHMAKGGLATMFTRRR